ncbi:MAG TPA: aminodeoxychorismate synthase component I [Sedimenticola sp.]|nr:aminodeoxychorismate synthase component I [Sedimenticola sp.]
MTGPLRRAMPYFRDSARLFEALRDLPWAVFLDSGRPHGSQGRYDILAADPMAALVTRGLQTEIRDRRAGRLSAKDPFHLVRQALQPRTRGFPDIPFCGGAIGYFGYDLARRLERLPESARDAEHLPEMAVGIYDWALVVDHQAQQSWLVGQGRDAATREKWDHLVRLFSEPGEPAARPALRVLGHVRSNMTRAQYAEGFARIERYIRDGDCYQVNFAQRFAAPVEGDGWSAYRALRQSNPAPYAAYLSLPFAQVLSCSPEDFLRVRGDKVLTRPIKGTCPRGADPDEDRMLAQTLGTSSKDRAENLMIVDLLRNDLGKSCVAGSIRVPQMFRVESFPTVHHLVSTVTGRLAPGEDALTLLRGCFPGGSITGAPKLRAMEIIEELEPHRRGIYCGAIGYLGFDGDMDLNIAIRTLVCSDGIMRFWAGGGIVADSVMDQEYQETFHKAAAMLRLFH